MKNEFLIRVRFGKDKKTLRIPGYKIKESKDLPTIAIDLIANTAYLVEDLPKSWRLHRLLGMDKTGAFQIITGDLREVQKPL